MPERAKTLNDEEIVKKASRFVHVSNGTATIDSRIASAFDRDQIALVHSWVDRFNELPPSIRRRPHEADSGAVKTHGTTDVLPRATAYQWHYDVYWWGVRLWINTYLAQNFTLGMAIVGGAIGGEIGGLLGVAAGAAIGAIVGGITSSALQGLDTQCGGKGVFIDINWNLWVHPSPVCYW